MKEKAEEVGSWDRAADAGSEADADSAISALSNRWRCSHKKRTKEVERELLQQYANSPSDERLLLALAASDLALSETLADAQVQLAGRIVALIDNPKLTLALTRSLREVTTCRGSATRRVEEVLQTAGVLRGQRGLVQATHLRRVV